MKILLANTTIGKENDPGIHEIVMPVWKRNYGLVKNPDTEIVARFNTWGCDGIEGTFNYALWQLNGTEVFYSALHAQEQGFDAVLITCFDDPWLWQLRQMINIPVVGFGEASMTYATLMGDKFGLLTFSDHNLYRCKEQIARLGLTHRCANVRALNLPEEHVFRGFQNAHEVIERFKEVARELIADGAEVIIPGCGLISPVLRFARGMEDEYPNGLTEVDGVPVLDILSIGLKTAEMMAQFRRAGIPWISHSGKYELPSDRMLESGKMCLSDCRQGFWDMKLF